MNELVSTNFLFAGDEHGEEILVYAIAEGAFKWELIYMIGERSKRVKAGKPVLFITSDTEEDDDFVDEMCNEHPFQTKNKVTNKPKWEWKRPARTTSGTR